MDSSHEANECVHRIAMLVSGMGTESRRLEAFFAESPSDRAEVAEFVARVYREAYGAAPPLADAYAAVTSGGELVCCVGMDWPGSDGRLAIERAWGIDRRQSSIPFDRAAQCCRWASRLPMAGALALYAVAVFAIERGTTVVLVEHNARLHRHCETLGLVFHEVPHSELDLSAIPEVARPTY